MTKEARPPVSAAGLITRQARLSFDDDQIFRRRPELVDVLDLEIAAEARSVTLRRFGVIETLSGNDLISSRGIGHCDLLDVTHVDRRELLAIQIARRHQRPSDTSNQEIRAPFLDDDPLLMSASSSPIT